MTIELVDYFPPLHRTRIHLIGVGASGITGQLLRYIRDHRPRGMRFLIADVAAGIPERSAHCRIVQLDDSWVQATLSSSRHRDHDGALEAIRHAIQGADVIFVASETGEILGEVALSIAAICKEMEILTVGVAIMPPNGECASKIKIAKTNLEIFRSVTDSLLIIDDRLRKKLTGFSPSLPDFIYRTNAAVGTAIVDICRMVSMDTPNGADIEDFKIVLRSNGPLLIGIGKASGEHRVREVVEQVLRSAQTDGDNLLDGQGVLILLKAAAFVESDKLGELRQVKGLVRQAFAADAHVIHVTAWEDTFDEELSLTVVIAGWDPMATSTNRLTHADP